MRCSVYLTCKCVTDKTSCIKPSCQHSIVDVDYDSPKHISLIITYSLIIRTSELLGPFSIVLWYEENVVANTPCISLYVSACPDVCSSTQCTGGCSACSTADVCTSCRDGFFKGNSDTSCNGKSFYASTKTSQK